MPSNQVRPSAWTPLRTAALKKSLLADSRSSQDVSSTNSDNSFTNSYELTQRIPPVHSSLIIDSLLQTAVQKASYFKGSITSIHILLSNVKSKAARQTERTYIPRWPRSWPAKPCADYKIYKKYDEIYRTLYKKLSNHCFRHQNVQLRTPEFLKRIQLCTSLAEAALKTARARLEFLAKYPDAFQKFKQIATHIHEASMALASAERAVRAVAELTPRK